MTLVLLWLTILPVGKRQFVEMMNNYAENAFLKDTHFETVHGLDAPGQHSSAYDLAVLSRAIIHGEPEFYHMYSEKSLHPGRYYRAKP